MLPLKKGFFYSLLSPDSLRNTGLVQDLMEVFKVHQDFPGQYITGDLDDSISNLDDCVSN